MAVEGQRLEFKKQRKIPNMVDSDVDCGMNLDERGNRDFYEAGAGCNFKLGDAKSVLVRRWHLNKSRGIGGGGSFKAEGTVNTQTWKLAWVWRVQHPVKKVVTGAEGMMG